MNLTAKQEKFAQGVASGLSQADAYRLAYETSKKWPDKSVHEAASKLASNIKIISRISELRAPVIEACQLTLVAHLAELNRLKMMAEAGENVGAAIRAEELRGKASGLYVERVERGDPGAFTGSRDELNARIKERAIKLGVVVPKLKRVA